MGAIIIVAIVSVGLLSAEERLGVYVCNYGKVSASGLARAKAETEAVFLSSAVRIEWRSCDENPLARDAGGRWLLLRLRSDRPPAKAGTSSLDDMGRAFIAEDGGYIADAYFRAIQDHARGHQADAGRILGQVMAHELGHLLLGPGHSRNSIMRAQWTLGELTGLHQRWMTFDQSQREIILRNLRATGGSE